MSLPDLVFVNSFATHTEDRMPNPGGPDGIWLNEKSDPSSWSWAALPRLTLVISDCHWSSMQTVRHSFRAWSWLAGSRSKKVLQPLSNPQKRASLDACPACEKVSRKGDQGLSSKTNKEIRFHVQIYCLGKDDQETKGFNCHEWLLDKQDVWREVCHAAKEFAKPRWAFAGSAFFQEELAKCDNKHDFHLPGLRSVIKGHFKGFGQSLDKIGQVKKKVILIEMVVRNLCEVNNIIFRWQGPWGWIEKHLIL